MLETGEEKLSLVSELHFKVRVRIFLGVLYLRVCTAVCERLLRCVPIGTVCSLNTHCSGSLGLNSLRH